MFRVALTDDCSRVRESCECKQVSVETTGPVARLVSGGPDFSYCYRTPE